MANDRMLRSVAAKTLRDQRRALVGWSLGIVALSLLIAAVYPSVRAQSADFQKVVEGYPPAMKAFFGGLEDLGTPEGFLGAELFTLMLPLLFLVHAIGRGTDAIAGEEERGALEMLLSFPITRRRIVLEKAAALLAGALLLGLVLYATLALSALAAGMGLNLGRLAGATLLLVLYALLFGALALAVGAATGRRGLAVAVAVGVAVAGYLLDGVSRLTDGLAWAKYVAPHHYYGGVEALKGGMDWAHAALLAALVIALVLLAALAFDRRDLGRS